MVEQLPLDLAKISTWPNSGVRSPRSMERTPLHIPRDHDTQMVEQLPLSLAKTGTCSNPGVRSPRSTERTPLHDLRIHLTKFPTQ